MKRLNTPNGILMPTIDSFYERTSMAINAQPQEGNFFFLPGKGWGAEIAIRGQIHGRKKHSKYLHTIPYRSHSDFELYATPKDFSYTQDFKDLFGAQEVYEETRTKMFGRTDNNRNPIPVGYLQQNSETTILNGTKIKTLNLEFLFADKLISESYKFDKPNNHGRDISDSACIALLYDLDVNEVKKIINDFYIQPRREFILSKINDKSLKERGKTLLNKINNQKEFEADDRYLPSILSYTQALSLEELKHLYNDESKWEKGKLKDDEAIKIIQTDIEKYRKNVDNELREVSQEDIFKKIDTFFLITENRRKEMDSKMNNLDTQIKNVLSRDVK